MKIHQEHIDQIRVAFETMQSKEDLLHLLNQAKPLIYGDKTIPFKLKQITYYANPKLDAKRYSEFKIKKKSGADRSIHAPVAGLKAIQRVLSFILQCVFEPHKAAMGFVRDRSIVDNARLHEGSNYVYNIDLKDFFPSIDQARVWKCLQLKPFNLNDNDPLPEFKVKEDPDTTFLILSNHAVDKDINDIIWKISYDGYKFIQGNFTLKLKDGGSILYNVNKDNGKENEGTITVFVDKSRFEQVRSVASAEAKRTQLDSPWVLKYIVWKLILSNQQKYYNLSKKSKLANYLAALCCTEMEVERMNPDGEWIKVKRNVLPQGAPTSPVITNIICQRIDFLLSGVAKRFGLKYSRYADDITFSSMHNVYQHDSIFLTELHRIIAEQGFHIKERKTRLQKDGYRKEVTGLLVNEKANVQKRYIKQLRMWLYYWERYGYDRAYSFFLRQYLADKGNIVKGKPDMANVIGGKLDYLKMVKGSENELYLKLKVRFDALIKIDKNGIDETKPDHLESILSLIKSDEINESMDLIAENTIGKLRISINPLNSIKGQVKLKRKIIVDKGETLPYEKFAENNEKEEKEINLSKHKPIDVTRFLLNFRASEGLKFLTHDYDKTDSEFEYENILSVAKKEFDELSSQFVIPPSLWARINQFAFGDPTKVWRFNRIAYKLNWKSPELLTWINCNPNIHPIKNEYFEKGFITPFKKSIEIKAPELEYIFKNKLAENLESKYLSFDIELIDLDKANFYTNIDALQVGISYIFKAIKQRFSNSNKIKVEFSRKTDSEGRKRIIKIVHIDSACNKALDKNELLQGDLLEAEKAFFGICDWSIISRSPDDSINMLNILFDVNSNKNPKEKIDDFLIEGFTHVLTFYS